LIRRVARDSILVQDGQFGSLDSPPSTVPNPAPRERAAPRPGTPPRDAIPVLVDAYGDRVYRLGLRICPTPSEAEDLVQETMVAALRSWSRFKGDSHPYTWLFRIAMRTCRRMHRKRVGEPDHMIPLDELLGLTQGSALRTSGNAAAMSSSSEVSQQKTVTEEVRRRLDTALRRIPTVYRVALVLKDIADFSLEEIAEILEIQPATAKTRVHRGRIHLRRALDEEGVFAPLPSSDVPRQVCLDLLNAKLDAMDRGADFPFPHGEICDRCFALFRSMDLTQEACASLRAGTMPDTLRERLRALSEDS
jgi:RNA polymerase sigma-70 factor (ECF subfamily)